MLTKWLFTNHVTAGDTKRLDDCAAEVWHRAWLTLAIAFLLFLLVGCDSAPDWKVGIAKVKITPQESIWMGGYAARTQPSQGTLQDLWAKAITIQDSKGRRVILVTADILGFSDALSSDIAREVAARCGITRGEIVFSATHIHTGPVLSGRPPIAYPLSEEQSAVVRNYTERLTELVVQLVDASLADLKPSRLSYGQGKAGFGTNRRVLSEEGVKFGANPEGVVDHAVPVLTVESPGGELRAVIFGYACHNTTLGPDIDKFHGDYAGVAQQILEDRFDGAEAMFILGCGADCDPQPRLKLEYAGQHGEEMAAAVVEVINGGLEPVDGPLRGQFFRFPVEFESAPSQEELEARLEDGNIFVRRHAAEMLKLLDRNGHLPSSHDYTVQVFQFGRKLTFVALAGEVVADYALRLKEELGADQLWVAGYCNDVFAYIPSRRILAEGGYEADSSTLLYGLPARFKPEIEEKIVSRVVESVRALRPN